MVVFSHLLSCPAPALPNAGDIVSLRAPSSCHWPRSLLLPCSTSAGGKQLNLVDSKGNDSAWRFLSSASCSCLAKLISAGQHRRKAPSALGKSSNPEASDDSETNDVEATDDTLRATLEKSKKVLELQKNLLQQIVEKKKQISSLKESKLNKGQGQASYDQSDSSFSNSDTKPKGEGTTYNSWRSSGLSAQKSGVGKDGKEKISAPKNSLYDNEKSKDEPTVEKSIADTLGLQREADLYRDADFRTNSYGVETSLLSEPANLHLMSDKKAEVSSEAAFQVLSYQQDMLPDEGNIDPPPLAGPNVMNVILVAAECAPWIKTGGLGDVSAALPKALARRGHRVMVVIPRYGNYAEANEVGVRKRYKVAGQEREVAYFHAFIDGVDFVFIDSPTFHHIENDIYGGCRLDILKRMILFCKAAVEVPWHVPCGGVCYGDGNLVFIANDWHTSLLPIYLKAYYRDNGLMSYTRCVLVIHNIAHQGRGPVDDFLYVDLPSHYLDLFRMYDPVGGEHFNIFAAGLKTADRVVTVSHGYAWEVKTSEGGWGLHGIINENDWKFQGIVNGIDTEDWNPKFDVHLKSDGYTNYSLETLKEGKAQCKAALQRELGLPVRDDVPLICFIGRLDHQKGIDLIAEAMPWMVDQNVQLVMLGSGRQDLEDMLRRFENEHHDRVRGWVGFSVKTAHRLTAGADVLLMPSRFEPCGLNQLYAMMYGTIPVVHAVGGLRDTVQQYDPYNEAGLGWTFDRAESHKLMEALGHCLNTYRNHKNSWEGLQKRGMMQDLSWDNAAQSYEEVLVAAKYQW